MTWMKTHDPGVVLPSLSICMDDCKTPPTAEDSDFVECDEPICHEAWDVIGPGPLTGKDQFLREQGWSAVPTPEGDMEHKCLAHA